MFDAKSIVASISAEPAEKEAGFEDAGLQAAAEDVLIALGQDYGAKDSESGRIAFQDKAKHLAEALDAYCEVWMKRRGGGEYGE